MNRKLVIWMFAAFATVSSATAVADIQPVTAKIKRLLISSDGSFGNCMVALDVGPETVLPACRAGWVSFSCDGTYMDKNSASKLLENAQISFLLDRVLKIYVDDSIRHNNYCVGVRVDLF